MNKEFPITPDNSELAPTDFRVFSKIYSSIVKQQIPTLKEVCFLTDKEDFNECLSGLSLSQSYTDYWNGLEKGDLHCLIDSEFLLLPFETTVKPVVALVTSQDSVFLRKVREDWLSQVRDTITREFKMLKQARVDLQTGLLNLPNLLHLLATGSYSADTSLVLLALPSKRSTPDRLLRHLHRCTLLLKNFMRGRGLVHYLGQNIFCVLRIENSGRENSEIGSKLTAYLKREGLYRVHIGSSCFKGGSHGQQAEESSGKTVLDEAWMALNYAVKRGPYSFCDYGLVFEQKHPFAAPSKSTLRKLSRQWSTADSFTLILFQGDNSNSNATELIPSYLDRGVPVFDGNDLFLVLTTDMEQDIKKWVDDILVKASNDKKDTHVSAGISVFPFADFSKSEQVINCKKALLHASFYGQSSCAVFDPLSLNISGDVYFGDGDFVQAVREYKRGLLVEAGVNLYNSLGVTLALMNRHSSAVDSFEKALVIDQQNFMALYNLGLAWQTKKHSDEARKYFELAINTAGATEADDALLTDLKLQLGILNCKTGNYQAAYKYLQPLSSEKKNNEQLGRLNYYLGEVYYHLNDHSKAMRFLQKALQFDSYDDRAMSLLGKLYLEQNEGNEIALSLCQKSVELEPSKHLYRLRLAEVLIGSGRFYKARDLLYRCLRNRGWKKEAQQLLAKGYDSIDDKKRARAWFLKAGGTKS